MTNALLYHYSAELVRVIDGDSCVLRCDLGFRTWRVDTFRLAGINCPEMNTPAGQAAKEFAEQWFKTAGPLTIHSQRPDKYGRGVATIWGNVNGVPLNEALLMAGHAVKY